MKYCIDANAIINIEFAGMLSDLGQMASQSLLCVPEGVLRELTDTTTKIGEKIKNWTKLGCIHYLSEQELVDFKQLNETYGPPFKIGNIDYRGFWATPSGTKGVDAQVVTVAKNNNYIVVTNDNTMHGASYLENVECMRFEELCRRMKISHPKLL